MPKIKYYYEQIPLVQYCYNKEYNYQLILNRIIYMKHKNILSIDEIIIISINKYIDKLHTNKLKLIFNSTDINKDNIKQICEFLNIDINKVYNLNIKYNYKDSINILWYFKDRDINKLLTNIKNLDLYDLIGIYKSNVYDTREYILIKMKKYINKVIYSICNEYNIKVNKNNYNDFLNEINMYFMIFLNNTVLNENKRIIKYMDLTVKGYFKTFIKKYKKDNNIYSLDEPVNENSTKLDYIKDESNSFKRLENILSKDDLSFILLKYDEGYTNESLAKYYNISIDEVNERCNNILTIIRENI